MAGVDEQGKWGKADKVSYNRFCMKDRKQIEDSDRESLKIQQWAVGQNE